METKLNLGNVTIESIAYIEMYVGNIFHSKNFFLNALKFQHIATRKHEDRVSFLLQQGEMRLVLTSNLTKDSPVLTHLADFGDGVKKISFCVEDTQACFDSAVHHGSKVEFSPQDKHGILAASVVVFNQVEHEFLQMSADAPIPGFEYHVYQAPKNPMVFNYDHIALCHPKETILHWVSYYQNAFGFSENKNEDIYSEESGMRIIIMKSPNGKIKFPLVEPSSDRSPLHTYLKYNHGAGVHHIALETNDIISAVEYYEAHFGELRKAPASYYDEAKVLYPDQVASIENIAPFGIMLEQDSKGVLFQIFTKPVVTRPTLFLEFVQRQVCEGFGTVNIKALYETLEA